MKHIEKQKEPETFTAWKALANDDWQPSWHAFAGEPKRAVHRALLDEQGHLCCYCGQRIKQAGPRSDDTEISHIEHLRPRGAYKDLQLDYTNLLASCLGKVPKGVPTHCGQHKDNWFSEEMVHPLREDCESRLTYTADGHVHPFDIGDVAAQETIDHLALDIPKLKRLRAQEINVFLEPVLDGTIAAEVLIDKLEQHNRKGRYQPFCFAVIQVLKGFLSADHTQNH